MQQLLLCVTGLCLGTVAIVDLRALLSSCTLLFRVRNGGVVTVPSLLLELELRGYPLKLRGRETLAGIERGGVTVVEERICCVYFVLSLH
jgi:hypothetical protein